MTVVYDEVVYRQVDPVVTPDDQIAKELGMYVAKVIVDVAVRRYGEGQRP